MQDVKKVYSNNVLAQIEAAPVCERVTCGKNSQFRQLVNITNLRNALNKLAKILADEVDLENKVSEGLSSSVKNENLKVKHEDKPEALQKPVYTKQDHVTVLSDIVDKCVRTTIGPVVKSPKKEVKFRDLIMSNDYIVPKTNVPDRDITGIKPTSLKFEVNDYIQKYAEALCRNGGIENDEVALKTLIKKVYWACYDDFDKTLLDMLKKEGKSLRSVGLGKSKNSQENKAKPYSQRILDAGYTPLLFKIAHKYYNAAGLQ